MQPQRTQKNRKGRREIVNYNRATAENTEKPQRTQRNCKLQPCNRREHRKIAEGAEGDTERKEVLKLGSWENGEVRGSGYQGIRRSGENAKLQISDCRL